MEAIRAYKFRIYPGMKGQAAIDNSISMPRRPYNKLLENTIGTHKSNPPSKISRMKINQFLNEITKDDRTYLQLYADVMAGIRNRLLEIYQNFSRRYIRNKYGMQMDKDISASISMLNRTTIGQEESHAKEDVVSAVQQASKSCIEGVGTDKTRPWWDAAIA